jgi:flagellar capping protein FliD
MKKGEFITRKYLDKTLDKRLAQHAQVIVAAVDGVLTKRFVVFGQEMDEKIGTLEGRLGKKIDNVQTLIDGYVKAQEEFKQEFVIMKEEMKQMKKIIKEKLGVEIRLI